MICLFENRVKIGRMLIRNPKRAIYLICLALFGLILLIACQTDSPSPAATTSERDVDQVTATPKATHVVDVTPTPQVTHLPTDTPDEIAENCCADHRIALLQKPTTLNYWRYLAEDNSPWTKLVIGNEAPSLFTYPALHLPKRMDFVPALAFELPPVAEEQGDFWVIPVKMLPSATWSDGEPITADDVVFTVQTVFDLQLGGRWADFYARDRLTKVEASDDHTVVFFFNAEPRLSEWQFAAAMGPILPQHFWAEYVAQAGENIEGIEPPGNCIGDLSLPEISACQAYDHARQILFEVEPVSAPSGGGYMTTSSLSAATLRQHPNPHYFAAGVKIIEYTDGTWERIFPDGTLQQFYGQAAGEILISYHRGPFSSTIDYKVYDSATDAYDALLKGSIDTLPNPYGQTDDWIVQAIQSKTLSQYPSQQNGLAYLAFNMRRSPGALPEFRQALEILVDPQEIAENDLANLVNPAYSIVPPGNAFWWNSALMPADEALSTQDRLALAVQTLKDAGWAWKTEPTWNAGTRRVIPGEDLRLPDGQLVPEIQFIFPLHDDNLLMSVFGEAIAESLQNLGVPLVLERLSREQVINRTLIAGGSFDLYILDWQFPLYPGYLCDLFHGQNDTLLTGGYNTTGYNSLKFDETCDNFLTETDLQEAQGQAFRLQSQLAYDRPYLPLYHPKIIDIASNRVVWPYLPHLGGFSGQGIFLSDARVLIK